MMKYVKTYKLEGKIKLVTGLHVGENKDKVEIGGIDSPVIKNPMTRLPYIPGSSIKGKMRFLLEWALGKVDIQGSKGEPHTCKTNSNECEICRIFGSTEKTRIVGPTRLKVNDCPFILPPEKKDEFENGNWSPYEEKIENSINRLTGTAIHPRRIERVCADSCFDFKLTYSIYEIDETDKKENVDENNWNCILTGLYLLQEDALGGSGSRGYGRFEFQDLKFFDGEEWEQDFKEIRRAGKKITLETCRREATEDQHEEA